MSQDEEQYDEDEEIEEEEEPAEEEDDDGEEEIANEEAVPEKVEGRGDRGSVTADDDGDSRQQYKKRRRSRRNLPHEESSDLTEAEKAMIAAKKRQEEEQAAKLQDYEEKRRIEREKEEEELRKLKEKKERRRQEREEEERQFAERRRQEEEARRLEEEERKARIEAEKRKKEEEKMKRQMHLAGTFASAADVNKGGRNFIIPKRQKDDRFISIIQAKEEMGMTKQQQEEAKKNFLTSVAKTIEYGGLAPDDLKEKIKQLHQRICKLEAEKYDLEKRRERQQYDLKELNERQRQMYRSKAKTKGIDPNDTLSTRYPPKVSLISKYERQIDRRNFAERRAVYENKHAYPCFPNVPPPPARYDKIILSEDKGKDEVDQEDIAERNEDEEEE